MSQQKIIDLVRKLLAKANDAAATPEEAAAFAAKASQMLIEHGLDETSIGAKAYSVGERLWKAPYADDLWFRRMVQNAAPAFMCQLVLTKTHSIVKSRKTGQDKLATKTAFILVGKEERTAVLEDVCGYLYTTIVRLARAYSSVRRDQLSFMRGAGQAVADRFYDIALDRRLKAEDEAKSSGSDSRALVLVTTALTEVEDYMSEKMSLKAGRRSSMRRGSGFGSGYDAGSKLNLGDQIGHSAPTGELE